MAQRSSLPHSLLAERKAMFANGAFPSDEEYELFNEKVKNTPGLAFYTAKTHSNYRSRLLREAKARRTTRGDADAIERMTGAGTVQQRASGRVGHVSPSTLTSDSDASTSTHASHAPRLHSDGLLNDAALAELVHKAAMRDPNTHAQIHAAVARIVQWADVSGVPALDLFRLYMTLHVGEPNQSSTVSSSSSEYDDSGPGCIDSGAAGVDSSPAAAAHEPWSAGSPVYCGNFPVPYDFGASF